MHYVYQIINLENGKKYIGVSNNPERRWYEHCNTQSKYYSMIHAAIEKYGTENFLFEVLEQYEDRKDALKREKELISLYRTQAPYGYNIHEGGGEPPKQNKITEDQAFNIIKQLKDLKIPRKTIIKNNKITYAILENINLGKAWRQEDLSYPIRPNEKEILLQRANNIKEQLKNTLKSQKEIAKEFGVSRGEVCGINSGKRFFDEKENYPLRKPIKGNRGKCGTKNTKKVKQFDLNDNLIATYSSVIQAAEAVKGSRSCIAACCRGEQKTSVGYKWQYDIDE